MLIPHTLPLLLSLYGLLVDVHSYCLLNTQQILACDKYRNESLYDINIDNDDKYNNISKPSLCRGYYYCTDTTYCHNIHDTNVNLTCTHNNDILSCQCAESSKCYYDRISCYSVSLPNGTDTWYVPVRTCAESYFDDPSTQSNFYINQYCCIRSTGCKHIIFQNTDNDVTSEFLINWERILSLQKQSANRFKYLYVDLSQLDTVKWKPFQIGYSKIKYLNLSLTRFHANPVQSFYAANFLEELYLSHTKLTYIGHGSFQNCRVLKKLDLTNNIITNVGPAVFASCYVLEDLDLSEHIHQHYRSHVHQ